MSGALPHILQVKSICVPLSWHKDLVKGRRMYKKTATYNLGIKSPKNKIQFGYRSEKCIMFTNVIYNIKYEYC